MRIALRLVRPAWLPIDLDSRRRRRTVSPIGIAPAVRERVARPYLSGERAVSIRARLGPTA